MGLINWSEEKIRALSMWDFAILKIILVLFGMIIGAYFSTFVKQYVWCFVGTFVIGYAWVIYKILIKK